MDNDHRWFVRVTTTTGASLYWHRGGTRHSLAFPLGPHWVANFKPALFQITAEGSIIPRDSQPQALDIASVALEAVPGEPSAGPGAAPL